MRYANAIMLLLVVGAVGCKGEKRITEPVSEATIHRNNLRNCEDNSIERRYIMAVGPDGWLKVKLNGTTVSLPKYLKVTTYKICNGREYFTINEGILKGKNADTWAGNLEIDTSSIHIGPVDLRLKRSTNIFTYRDTSGITYSCSAVEPEYKENPKLAKIPVGTWDINIPDYPHGAASEYRDYTALSTIWFRIASESADGVKDRYLHVGKISHGCLTAIPDKIDWNTACLMLLRARLDDYSVGRLEVID